MKSKLCLAVIMLMIFGTLQLYAQETAQNADTTAVIENEQVPQDNSQMNVQEDQVDQDASSNTQTNTISQ